MIVTRAPRKLAEEAAALLGVPPETVQVVVDASAGTVEVATGKIDARRKAFVVSGDVPDDLKTAMQDWAKAILG